MLTVTSRRPKLDPQFILDPFEPAYLSLYRLGEIQARVAAGLQELIDCCACPRNCHVNRLENQARVCHSGRYARVGSAFPHFGEEDCLRGWNGSGTIFFALCNLRCVFCQNWDISQQRDGREMTATGIAAVMLRLQQESCHNLTFVPPDPGVPQGAKPTPAPTPRGLIPPI